MIARVAMLALLASSGLSLAAEFPLFQVNASGTGAQQVASLVHGDRTVLRWRAGDGTDPTAILRKAAERLNELAWDGLGPADVAAAADPLPTAGPARPANAKANGGKPAAGGANAASASIRARGQLLLRVSAAQAKLGGSTPVGLAALWASSIGRAFSSPYVMVRNAPLQVPVGERRSAEYGGRVGGLPDVTAQDAAVADVTVGQVGRAIEVVGRQPGETTLSVRVGSFEAYIPVVVRKWAARVQSPITVRVSGSPAGNPWLERTALLAAECGIQAEPGATARVKSIAVSSTGGSAQISASGTGFFPLDREVPFTFQRVAFPEGDPVRSILSNDPERVGTAQPLMRYAMVAHEPTHFLWHHVCDGARPLHLSVRLSNSGETPAQVHVTGADAGPSPDEVYVGHVVMQRFQAAGRSRTGSLLEIPARQAAVLSCLPMPPSKVVSGFARLTMLEGDGVFLETEAVERKETPGALSAVPRGMSLESPTRFLQLPGYKALQLSHEVGKRWGFLHIGKAPDDAVLHPRLKGDYGVVHDVSVTFENPSGIAARVEVSLRSGGGAARAVVEVDGELVETGLLLEGDEHVLFSGRVAGAKTPAVRLRIIPQSGSNYPMTVTARSYTK